PYNTATTSAEALASLPIMSSVTSSTAPVSLPVMSSVSGFQPTTSLPLASSASSFALKTSTGHYNHPPMCADPSLGAPVLSLSHLTVKREEDWALPSAKTGKIGSRPPKAADQKQHLPATMPQQPPRFQPNPQSDSQVQSFPPQPSGHRTPESYIHACGPDNNAPAPRPSNAMVPSWSMPPKVLLVEDDDTCRRLSAKLLQIFGCPFDVAEDGIAAVGKMSHQKYDIVLM
ncbi:hypothetical protein BGW38_009831, partial [Lunasporangiospora selenospora]